MLKDDFETEELRIRIKKGTKDEFLAVIFASRLLSKEENKENDKRSILSQLLFKQLENIEIQYFKEYDEEINYLSIHSIDDDAFIPVTENNLLVEPLEEIEPEEIFAFYYEPKNDKDLTLFKDLKEYQDTYNFFNRNNKLIKSIREKIKMKPVEKLKHIENNISEINRKLSSPLLGKKESELLSNQLKVEKNKVKVFYQNYIHVFDDVYWHIDEPINHLSYIDGFIREILILASYNAERNIPKDKIAKSYEHFIQRLDSLNYSEKQKKMLRYIHEKYEYQKKISQSYQIERADERNSITKKEIMYNCCANLDFTYPLMTHGEKCLIIGYIFSIKGFLIKENQYNKMQKKETWINYLKRSIRDLF